MTKYDSDDIDENLQAYSELFSFEKSTFMESNHFLCDVDPLEEESLILLGFKIHPNENPDYFLNNWWQVSGLGNLLFFLKPKFRVKKVRFLHNVRNIPKEEHMFLFIVMVEFSHKVGDQIYVLDYVQKSRSIGHIGFISVYKPIQV